jgi:hypothetical protein
MPDRRRNLGDVEPDAEELGGGAVVQVVEVHGSIASAVNVRVNAVEADPAEMANRPPTLRPSESCAAICQTFGKSGTV